MRKEAGAFRHSLIKYTNIPTCLYLSL
uniref:Uncharacterized protein n=1 Tax=Anguilla anguilla TaxID=7936 RepID=A0A0E9RBF5_ANGAN